MTPAAQIAAAIELIESIEQGGRRPADAIAQGFFRERRYIGSSDRRAISENVWSVLRARRRIGWWISSRAGGKETPRLLVAANIMLGNRPLEAVEEVFTGGRFGPMPLSGMELAVLRKLSRQRMQGADLPESVRLEVPLFILPALRARFGEALEAEMAAMAGVAPLDLRANALKVDRETARLALKAEGIETEPMRYSPWGLRSAERADVTGGAAFRQGLVEIQDEGSQIVSALVGAAPGMRVADWCAGAGGKTLAMAMTMDNRGQILACDVHDTRLTAAVKRLRRAGVHNVERHLIEPGDKWVKRRAGGFDRVLVDAPCTGTGTWRRNPDGRLRMTETDLAEILPKQAAILDEASRLVRPGGRLVYATCSLLQEENETQVEAFLERQSGFKLVPLHEAWTLPGPPPSEGPYLVLTPLRHGTDGFFAAVLERKEGA
jgi:16S rRNA (cytosine967-C5)-methyltransferase